MISFKLSKTPKVNLNWWPKTVKQWSPILRQENSVSWKQESDPDTGRPWRALNPRTELKKKKKFPGAPILRATGKMQDSMKLVPTGEKIMVSSTSYGAYHQFGTKRMEARPWVGIPSTAMNKLPELAWKNILSTR